MKNDLENLKLKYKLLENKMPNLGGDGDNVQYRLIELQNKVKEFEEKFPYLTSELLRINEIAKIKTAEAETYKIKVLVFFVKN